MKRYDLHGDATMRERPDGDYVSADKALARIAELEARNKALEKERDEAINFGNQLGHRLHCQEDLLKTIESLRQQLSQAEQRATAAEKDRCKTCGCTLSLVCDQTGEREYAYCFACHDRDVAQLKIAELQKERDEANKEVATLSQCVQDWNKSYHSVEKALRDLVQAEYDARKTPGHGPATLRKAADAARAALHPAPAAIPVTEPAREKS